MSRELPPDVGANNGQTAQPKTMRLHTHRGIAREAQKNSPGLFSSIIHTFNRRGYITFDLNTFFR